MGRPKAKSSASKAPELSKAAKKAIADLPKAAKEQAKGKSGGSACSRQNSRIVELEKGEMKKTRKLDNEVLRCIRRRFPDISESSMHGSTHDNKTLFQHLRQKKCEATLGGKYIVDETWDTAAKNYNISIVKPCAVKDKGEVVDVVLIQALNAAKTQDMTKRSRTALCSWFHGCKALNQRSLAGIIAHLCKLSPACNANAAHVVLAFVKLASRLGLKEQFPELNVLKRIYSL